MAIEIKPIETLPLWESFVEKNFPTALFQSGIWGQVQKNLGVPVWRYGFYNGNKLIGVAQIIKVRARRGTFLHVRHGPLLLSNSPAVWRQAVNFFRNLAAKEHCWFIRMNPLIPDSEENRKLLTHLGAKPAPIHAMDGELCWVLDLTPTQDELMAGMRKTTRYEIRRAQKLGVTVREGESRDIDKFLDLYKKTSVRHGFVPHKGLAQEFTVFSKAHRALLLLGYYDNTLTAGAIILFYGDQSIYHHGASIPSDAPVSHLVQWEAMLSAKKRGMKLYNFWGIAPVDHPNHPWQGISVFKKGFGGREIRYFHSHDIPVSPLYLLPYGVESVRRIMKGYS